MSTVAKADAVAALRACGGDVSSEGLHRAGLPCRQTTTLGKVLDDLGCTIKSGHGNLRQLVVSTDAAIAAIDAIEGDAIEVPDEEGEEPRPAFTVTHDPHENYHIGEAVSTQYLRDMVAMSRELYPDINGLEVSDGEVTYRIYHGTLYRLEDDEMIAARV